MIKRYIARRENPWELLILAGCFVLPGVALLITGKPVILAGLSGKIGWSTIVTVLNPPAARLFGAALIIVGLLVGWLYFYVLGYEPRLSTKSHDHLSKR
jgi:hypothetical protein